jgi:hypothetical protein
MSPLSPVCERFGSNTEDHAFRPNSPAETTPQEPPVRSLADVADEDLNEDLNEDPNNEDLNDADEDLNDSATVSGEEYVELMSSCFFRHQAQTFVPCVFEFEPFELLEVGPSPVRMINRRLDWPSATNFPAIDESRSDDETRLLASFSRL